MSIFNSKFSEFSVFGIGVLSLFTTLLIGKTDLVFTLLVGGFIIISEFHYEIIYQTQHLSAQELYLEPVHKVECLV